MSYPNNVLSLGHGPARHLPCGADDAYLELLDWEARNPPTECDAHVKTYYIQQMRAVCEDWNDEDAYAWWYPSGVIECSVEDLIDVVNDLAFHYNGGGDE